MSKGQATHLSLLLLRTPLPIALLTSTHHQAQHRIPNHVLFHSSNTILNMHKKPAVTLLKSSRIQLVTSKGRELVRRT